MARFRLFGRPNPEPHRPAGPPPFPAGPPGPPQYPAGGPRRPPQGRGGPPPAPGAGPATRAARPARSWRAPTDDPLTDPVGFAPIRAGDPGAGPPAPPVPADPPFGRHPARPPAPDPADAGALAGAFAVDYLSWDQDDPDRRGRVLLEYLQTPGTDPARLGWSGQGRQRADFALPGRVRPDGDGRVLVDVRVRVTPYRSVGEHGADGAPPAEPEVDLGVPASAPAPTGRGWRSLASHWIRLSVPISVDGGRLVVDAWEETLGEQPPAPAPAGPVPPDPTLADDDPLAEPTPGGAW